MQNGLIYVCGANGLIGQAVVNVLQKSGHPVLALDIAPSSPHELAENVSYHSFDISALNDLETQYGAMEAMFGYATGWVNCAYPRSAGFSATGSGKDDPKVWAEDCQSHLAGSCLSADIAARAMAQHGGGSIVALSSIYGMVGPDYSLYEGTDIPPPPPVYAAIKGGIISHAKLLAAKYAPDNVRVNVVSPGGVENNHPEVFKENYAKRVPMGRMGKAEEIAGPIAFLLSDAASYVTGSVLPIDGGWTAV